MTLRLRFWGTRGSIPSPGSATVEYGGNTPCVEVRTDTGWLVILDAGTGIRELGRSLVATANGNGIAADIFLTHAHWDHIQGIPVLRADLPAGESLHDLGLRRRSRRASTASFATRCPRSSFRSRSSSWTRRVDFCEIAEERTDWQRLST